MLSKFSGKKVWSASRAAVGRVEGGTMKSISGSPIIKIEGDRITTMSGDFIGHIKKSSALPGEVEIMDPLGNLTLRVREDGRIYDRSGVVVGFIEK